MVSLLPVSLIPFASVRPVMETAIKIRPTGLPSIVSGPAIPVVAREISEPVIFLTDSAIAKAVSSLTVPYFFKTEGLIPNTDLLEFVFVPGRGLPGEYLI